MRLKKSCFISLIVAVMLSLGLATPAMAVPQIPHAFYGSVLAGGEPAPDGVLISAKIGGVEYVTTTTLDGKYGYSPTFKVPADDPDTPSIEGGVEGDTIAFYIEGVQVTTYTFSNGQVTPLDLEIEELPEQPPAGGGGGGGTPTYYTETNLFGTEESFRISSSGKVLETIEATSADGNLTLTVPKDTICLDKDGDRLGSLEAAVDESPPARPEDAHVIGPAYDFGPDGATFDPALTLTWSYDPEALPEDVAEGDLVIAYYDEAAGEWVELDGAVDTEDNTITAQVEHFTTFAIIGVVTPPPPEPAAFTPGSPSVSPTEVDIGEAVGISISVANTGGQAGSYTVTLKINDVVEETREVTVAAGASETVTFTTSGDEAGTYSVDVNGLTGSFTVKEAAAPPPPPPEKPVNWPVILGIIAAVVAIAAIALVLLRHRRD